MKHYVLYVAPYVTRIENLAGKAVTVVKEIAPFFQSQHLPCESVAASFKNLQQVQVWQGHIL
ncbi:hypothetical protein J9303_10190 [Bacillaceae bacterium Marseille-Q3522]|nr:hypothetical protein [Bacillaceae bacterium Marseille-Q3522]